MSRPALVGILVLLISACGRDPAGTPRTPAPPAASAPAGTVVTNAVRGAMQDRTAHSPAEALFVEKCSMCHRQMGMGTVILARRMDPAMAMLEKRTDLTEAFVTAAVRNGIGNMPRIQRGEVSDEQLQTIARYLARSEK